MAREQYEAIAPGGFLCTAEHPSSDTDDPIVITVGDSGISDGSVATTAAAVAIAKPFAIVKKRPLIESPGG